MKKIKQELKAAGWNISNCNWQIENQKYLLEHYTISRKLTIHLIIIQQFKTDGSTTIYRGNQSELFNPPLEMIDTLIDQVNKENNELFTEK